MKYLDEGHLVSLPTIRADIVNDIGTINAELTAFQNTRTGITHSEQTLLNTQVADLNHDVGLIGLATHYHIDAGHLIGG